VTQASALWVDRWLAPEKLAPRASSLVRRCWLAALAITVIFIPLGLYVGEIAYYFPWHRLAPPLQELFITIAVALQYVVACALIATPLLVFRRTRGWAGLIAFSPAPIATLLTVGYLAFGIWPGPSHFVRYVDMTRYEVPWQYEPAGSKEPGPKSGFELRVYLPDFRPYLESRAEGDVSTRLYLDPAAQDALSQEVGNWRRWLGPTDETAAFGLNRLVSRDPTQGEAHAANSTVYYSRDAQGSIVRVIVCNHVGTCEERLLVGDLQYRIEYPAAEIARWQSLEERTIALFGSFRIPDRQPEEDVR